MHIAVALACVLAAGCGRVGFDLEPAPGIDALAIDAARAPLALDPGFPIVIDVDSTPGPAITTPAFSTPGP
ncbi:MAG TPA: hypothetical protein VGC42_15765, partial [Kofleriaceae bacterium]